MLMISSTVTVNNHLHSARRPSIAEVTLSLSLVVLLCSCLAWLSFFAGASVVFSSVCLSIRLPVYLYTHPSIYPSIHLSIHSSICFHVSLIIYNPGCLSVCMSISACLLSLYPPISLSRHLYVCVPVSMCLSTLPPVWLFICLPPCLFNYSAGPTTCLSVSLSIYQSNLSTCLPVYQSNMCTCLSVSVYE